MPELHEEPTLIAEIPRHEARATRLNRLQQEISRQPGIFLKAFEALGEEATADSLDIHDERVSTVDLSIEPRDLIKEYFTKRDDKYVEFDSATDDAMMKNEEYKKLVTASRDLRSEKIKTGVMRSETRENPLAESARNEVRRYTFGFFLRRAVTWNRQQAVSNDRLPSAG